jgi:hypothetical protein
MWKFVLLLLLFSVTGCTQKSGVDEADRVIPGVTPEKVVDVQNISEDARIYTIEAITGKGNVYTRKEIEYVRKGRTVKEIFSEDMVAALEWIKQDTLGDSTFLLWWDYGPSLEGYTGRNSLIIQPSKAILRTVSIYSKMSDAELEKVVCDYCEPDEKVRDVALALLAEDPKETADIMKKYDADYLLVHDNNRRHFGVFAFATGRRVEDYRGPNYEPTEKAFKTIVGRMLQMDEIEGFEKVYSDEKVIIYQLK